MLNPANDDSAYRKPRALGDLPEAERAQLRSESPLSLYTDQELAEATAELLDASDYTRRFWCRCAAHG